MMELQTMQYDGEERYITPVDDMGLPFCFAPNVKLPPVRSHPPITSDGFHDRKADLNHMFPKYEVATSQSPALADPVAKAALTGARVQWVDYGQHHDVYNNAFVGPEHPQTEEALFCTLTMASAGIVPEYALDLSGDEPTVVGQTAKRRKWLWTSGQVDVMCPGDVSDYLLNYVLETDVDHISEIQIEEFLYTTDYDNRIKLGHKLVEQIVERVAEPLEEPYGIARSQDVLTFVRVGCMKKPAPDNPRDLVKAKLRAGSRFGPVHSALIERLARQPHRSRSKFLESQVA